MVASSLQPSLGITFLYSRGGWSKLATTAYHSCLPHLKDLPAPRDIHLIHSFKCLVHLPVFLGIGHILFKALLISSEILKLTHYDDTMILTRHIGHNVKGIGHTAHMFFAKFSDLGSIAWFTVEGVVYDDHDLEVFILERR